MIEAQALVKRFGSKLAVDRVSFLVEQGEVLGFLGPNGAGKSTTMRMITGYLEPDSGSIKIGDYDMAKQPIAAKSLIGYLPENAPSYGEMTVDGFLRFVASIRGLSGRKATKAVDEVIETCFLEPVRYQSIDTLSKGYTHRTCFAQSILHDPQILILDEPTDGLDPNQKQEVRNLIRKMGQHKAIILSTHILEEVDAVCSRVIVINEGQVVANGTPSELRSKAPGAGDILITIRKADKANASKILGDVAGIASVNLIAEPDSRLEYRCKIEDTFKTSALLPAVSKACQDAELDVASMQVDAGRLEEVFRNITIGAAGGAS